MAIVLTDETKQGLIDSIKRYFVEERDEEIGDLQASFFLDFTLQVLGPHIYNQAIRDAQTVLHSTVADLDITLHEPETAFPERRPS